MGARTSGRVVALQILFGLDATGALGAPVDPSTEPATPDVGPAVARYWRSFEDRDIHPDDLEPDARAFGDALVAELVGRIAEIDAAVRAASAHWRLERMPRVDRNVARIGAFELLHRRDTPRAVAIDEAVELAKRFGGEESARFVNGVLEKVADDAGRAEPRSGAPSKKRGK